MADLEFVNRHNMVACLEKTGGNSEFHEIVDFLTSSLIHHALTVSHATYISYIEQFWNTASSQTVNDEKQIHATVDSKEVVVTEASIRSSLLLHDADGTACLTNEAIFQNLALMGYEGELNKLTFQKALFSPQWKYLIHTILHCQSSKSTSWNEFSTNITLAVICLETNQKFNFSKLIFDDMSRNLDTSKKKFLMKGVKFSRKVTPFFDFMLVLHQAPEGEGSEQPTKPQPTPSPTQPSTGYQPPVTDSSSSHDTTQDSRDSLEGTNRSEVDQVQSSHDSPLLDALETSKDAQAAEILKLKDQIKKLKRKFKPSISHHRAWLKSVKRLSMKKRLGRKESVSKQGRKNAKPEPTLDAFDDLDADGRDYMETKDVVKEGSTARPELSTAWPDVDATRQEDSMKEEKAKEKGVSIKDIKDSSRLIARDAEIARQLQVDLQAEVEKERQREEEASKAAIAETYDEIQAGIDADALSAEIRSRPLTKSQLRNLMMTYLKNMGGYKHSQLKAKKFEEIQDDAVKDSKEAAGVHKQKVLEEPNSTKVEIKQEGHEEKEEQTRIFEELVPEEEECIYYRIFRFDRSSRWIKTFSEMVTRFDRLDLVELYNLVMKRFETTTPKGVDLVLWGDLRTMFDANAEDELWQNQERWNLKSWDLYENCGVHTLILEDGTEIHMLAERKYPLTKETLERMLSLRLVAGTASEDAYTLLRFIQKQIDEYGSHDGGEKDL
ncbi:hypothetical protein Tco_0319155 [Tanacetum coccineum]